MTAASVFDIKRYDCIHLVSTRASKLRTHLKEFPCLYVLEQHSDIKIHCRKYEVYSHAMSLETKPYTICSTNICGREVEVEHSTDIIFGYEMYSMIQNMPQDPGNGFF